MWQEWYNDHNICAPAMVSYSLHDGFAGAKYDFFYLIVSNWDAS